MPYILNKTNGTVLVNLGDAAIDKSTDLTFVGRNYAGYGEIVNENLLHLLENFANTTAPSKPISGQLWYDTKVRKLKIYNGANFLSVPISTVSEIIPNNLTTGDFWYNSATGKFYVKTDSVTEPFRFIGPSTPVNDLKLVIVKDEDAIPHYILEHVVNGNIVAVVSNESFTVSTEEDIQSQFPKIKKGMTIVSTDLRDGYVAAENIDTLHLTTGDVSNEGSITGQWSLTPGSTLEATYADLAERYEADAIYEPGTVLVIGGDKEVTTTDQYADIRVAGIISTKPALKMNSDAGKDDFFPYIALKGRVPCKVIGNVKKGDLLVTSNTPGYARATIGRMESANAIIGKALEDFQGHTGVIEVKV